MVANTTTLPTTTTPRWRPTTAARTYTCSRSASTSAAKTQCARPQRYRRLHAHHNAGRRAPLLPLPLFAARHRRRTFLAPAPLTNCWQSAHIMPPSAQKTRRCMVCVDVGVSTVGLDYLGRLALAEQALRQIASTSHRAPIVASTHIDQDQSTITCSRPSYSPTSQLASSGASSMARRACDPDAARRPMVSFGTPAHPPSSVK